MRYKQIRLLNKVLLALLLGVIGLTFTVGQTAYAAGPGTCRVTHVTRGVKSTTVEPCDQEGFTGRTISGLTIRSDSCYDITVFTVNSSEQDETAKVISDCNTLATPTCESQGLIGTYPDCTTQAASTSSTTTGADCSSAGLESLSTDNGSCVVSDTADPALQACKSSSSDSVNKRCDLIAKYVNPAITVFSAIAGIVITMAIIYGGIMYSTSGGDAGKVTKAKSLIRNAVLSLIAYVFLWSFVQFLIPGGVFH